MVNVRVAVHPPAPVTVTVYVPAHNPVAVAAVPPLGAHAYVKGPFPAVTVTAALPLHCALHNTLVCVPVVVIAGGCVMLNVCVVVHPFNPVTVHVYVPAHRPVADALVPPEGAQA